MSSRASRAIPLFFAALILVLSTPPRTAWSEKQASKPVPGHVSERFEKFVNVWISNCQKSFRHTPVKMQVRKENGVVITGYTTIDKESITWKLKPTRSAQSPFVGILTYDRCEFESSGKDLQTASSGEFRITKATRVTEIFRYSGDTWQQ